MKTIFITACLIFSGTILAAPLGQMDLISVTLSPPDVQNLLKLRDCADTICAIKMATQMYPELIVLVLDQEGGFPDLAGARIQWRDSRISDEDQKWYSDFLKQATGVGNLGAFESPYENYRAVAERSHRSEPLILIKNNVTKHIFVHEFVHFLVSKTRIGQLGAKFVEGDLGYATRMVNRINEMQEKLPDKISADSLKDFLDFQSLGVEKLKYQGVAEEVDVARTVGEFSEELGIPEHDGGFQIFYMAQNLSLLGSKLVEQVRIIDSVFASPLANTPAFQTYFSNMKRWEILYNNYRVFFEQNSERAEFWKGRLAKP
jgi:hypothetical protein